MLMLKCIVWLVILEGTSKPAQAPLLSLEMLLASRLYHLKSLNVMSWSQVERRLLTTIEIVQCFDDTFLPSMGLFQILIKFFMHVPPPSSPASPAAQFVGESLWISAAQCGPYCCCPGEYPSFPCIWWGGGKWRRLFFRWLMSCAPL